MINTYPPIKIMTDFLSSIQRKAQEVTENVTTKATNLKDQATLKAGILERQGTMTTLYMQLGEEVYKSDVKAALSSDKAIGIIRDLQQNEDEINALNKELDEMKNITKCPNCGASIPNEMSFCGHCGTKRPNAE